MIVESRELTNQNQSNRISWIDSARGLLVILVVLGHMPLINDEIKNFIYSFHIPAFFIVSGILMWINQKWKDEKIIELVSRKAKAFLYPYLTLSILNVVFILIKDGLNEFIKSLVHTIMFDGIETLWYFPALFIAEILFVLISRIRKKVIILAICTFVLALTSVFYFVYNIPFESQVIVLLLKTANVLNRALIACMFIFVGYIASVVYSKLKANNTILMIIIGIILFAIVLLLFRFNTVDLYNSIIGNPILYYVNAICGSVGVLIFSKIILYRFKLLIFLGLNSIIVFTTHQNYGIISLPNVFVYNSFVSFLISFCFVMLIEMILIIVINKWFSFIINYNKLKEKLASVK